MMLTYVKIAVIDIKEGVTVASITVTGIGISAIYAGCGIGVSVVATLTVKHEVISISVVFTPKLRIGKLIYNDRAVDLYGIRNVSVIVAVTVLQIDIADDLGTAGLAVLIMHLMLDTVLVGNALGGLCEGAAAINAIIYTGVFAASAAIVYDIVVRAAHTELGELVSLGLKGIVRVCDSDTAIAVVNVTASAHFNTHNAVLTGITSLGKNVYVIIRM